MNTITLFENNLNAYNKGYYMHNIILLVFISLYYIIIENIIIVWKTAEETEGALYVEIIVENKLSD